MPLYMSRFSYTPEGWASLIENFEDRREAAAATVEAAGGKLIGLWYAFGEFDGYVIMEMPDAVSAAGVMTRTASSGAMRRIEGTVLMSVEEMREALGKAKEVGYHPPGRG
jgi:uncharacterized protein with GYD domain